MSLTKNSRNLNCFGNRRLANYAFSLSYPLHYRSGSLPSELAYFPVQQRRKSSKRIISQTPNSRLFYLRGFVLLWILFVEIIPQPSNGIEDPSMHSPYQKHVVTAGRERENPTTAKFPTWWTLWSGRFCMRQNLRFVGRSKAKKARVEDFGRGRKNELKI